MIRFQSKDGDITGLAAEGSIKDISSDLGLGIGFLYRRFRERGVDFGEAFRFCMQQLMTEESPVWDTDSSGDGFRGVTIVLPRAEPEED